jgi:serine/threonine-protein kinase
VVVVAGSLALSPRYRGIKLIASGGMADVYVATDEVLDRVVAIKALSERLAQDQELQARFIREAKIGAKLSCLPNVVIIFDVVVAEGRPAIVMEYLPGGTLADKMRAGRIRPAVALAWLEQAGRALDGAHAAGVIHRDVKPANLMFGGDEEVRVTDFGIARVVGGATLTSAGTILGSCGYLSPEQALGGMATAESDRYAFAAVAFELLTGRRPYEADSFAAEATAHVSAPIPAASDFDSSLPPWIDGVLARGLWKDPTRRPESCTALVSQLRRAFSADSEIDTVRVAIPVPAPSTITPSPGRARVAAVVAVLATIGLLGLASALALWPEDRSASLAATAATTTKVLTDSEARPVSTHSAPVTEVRTITTDGGQVSAGKTTTSRSRTPPPSETTARSPVRGASAAALNDRGYRLLQQGDPAAALPLLEQSVAALHGTGSLTEAYASYNLALARFSTGSCSGVAELLARSRAIQGERSEIARLLRDLPTRCYSSPGS